MDISFEKFIEEISKKELLLLGEVHGTKEIPKLTFDIIKKLNNNVNFIFLEIPKDQQIFLDKYTNSKDEKDLLSIPFFNTSNKDGRDSKDILFLIKKVIHLSSKIKIKFIDPNVIENRDYLMYKKIKELLKSQENKLSIFLTGNVHASKKNLIINDKQILTCGNYLHKWLKDKLISVNFSANKGSFFNIRLTPVNGKNRKNGIFISNEENYDFEYILDKFTPCDFL